MEIQLAKNFKGPNGWDRAVIAKEEYRELTKKIRAEHVALMGICMRDAERFGPDPKPEHVIALAVAFFEKRALHAYTTYIEFLENKVRRLRDWQNSSREAEAEPE